MNVELEEKQAGASYLKGILGHLGEGLCQLSPQLYSFICICTYILNSPWCFLGYQLLGGKLKGRIPTIFTVLYSFLLIPIIDFIRFFPLYMQEFQVSNFFYVIEDYIYFFKLGYFTEDLLLGLLFVGCGIFASWKMISTNATKIAKENENLVNKTVVRTVGTTVE